MLAVTNRVISVDGWRPKSACEYGGRPTSTLVGDILGGRDKQAQIWFAENPVTDEDRAAAVPAGKLVVLKMLDWTIIPIENLLARRGGNLIVQVENSDQARLMVEILEKGVDGVLLNTTNVNEIKKTAQIVHGVSEKVGLVEAVVATVRQLGMGDRACLDLSLIHISEPTRPY